ncbi:nucleotide-binding protein [Methylorubrum populi]
MSKHASQHEQQLQISTDAPSIEADFRASSQRAMILCLGGKGGVGKTTAATQIADLGAEATNVLATDADTGNEHFFKATMREDEQRNGIFIRRQPEIHAIKHRLRAEDHVGRIDTTALLDMLGVMLAASERILVVDFPAGDTPTTQLCAEHIVESCRDADVRLIAVVVVGAMDPTAISVLTDLYPLLKDCDRAVLARNTAQAVNFQALEASSIFAQIKELPNFRDTEMEKIGERLVEAHRVYNIPWRELATTAPMRIRVEARRLRRNFHAAWREAVRP